LRVEPSRVAEYKKTARTCVDLLNGTDERTKAARDVRTRSIRRALVKCENKCEFKRRGMTDASLRDENSLERRRGKGKPTLVV
jgi:hypothetical protein